VQVAIIGTRTAAHLNEALSAVDIDLSPETMQRIDDILVKAVLVTVPRPVGM
jgi:aryl-alcohol dehydrogenase-like predicted oxidoreductase